MKLRLSHDAWLAIGLLLVLILVTALSVIQQTRSEALTPGYVSTSTEPNGLQALREWLEALDYNTVEHTTATFSIPDDARVMVLAEPLLPVAAPALQAIDDWVEDGGTMLLAGHQIFTRQVLNHYDVSVEIVPANELTMTVSAPLMTGPVLPLPLPLTTRYHMRPERDDYVTLLAANGRSVAITFPLGSGRIVATTLPNPLTNAGLQQEGSAAYVLNLLSLTGEPAPVWFDDWHHGMRPSSVDSSNWLQQTAGGRAILLLGAILFLALALRGRRFGRPIPLPTDLSRRAPLEHITAIANLNRRAGHRAAVLQDYHDRLKRHIGFRYRLNPALPDDDFVTELVVLNPQLDDQALRALLQRLSQNQVSEAELVSLANEAARWQQR